MVQAGATLGEFYYRIAEKSNMHGFPSGICPTVGVGRHFSDGGYGTMMRKYGLSVDNIVDAQLINVNGKLLNRKRLQESDCIEMSWIESVMYYWGFPTGTPTTTLLSCIAQRLSPFKIKSDYVQNPISKQDFEFIFERMKKLENQMLAFNPYGGKMNEISEFAKPFPHRAEAFLNYRDLDIGINSHGRNAYVEGMVYGHKYFKETNYKRLVRVKTRVDPDNFFRNEQSIPTLSS
ncbi:hypothetical protein L1987_73907 [Smallanthus sonchifolius]|uniref:Uncharacterized protein n=1 Tax=Smallanthus sonchifolius TaxID=185202 RepID=A0ACB9A2S0_9ASTR|nr:hypothetical protein L1987_73907 [Smallanthus sonchifolius]